MIRHILLFKFNEEVGSDLREEAIERLRELGQQCPTIASWQVGVNETVSPSAYDVVEIGDFESTEMLDSYKAHPAHQDFSAFIRPLATWALADYVILEKQKPDHWPEVSQIPPMSILFKGARYRGSGGARGNWQYNRLRDQVTEAAGDILTPSQLGRTLVKLVTGKGLPDHVFTHVPGQGVSYNGFGEEADYRKLDSGARAETADRLLTVMQRFHEFSERH